MIEILRTELRTWLGSQFLIYLWNMRKYLGPWLSWRYGKPCRIWGSVRKFPDVVSDPRALRYRYSQHHVLCKDKDGNIIVVERLGRPGEYSLPFTSGFSAHKLAALVSSIVNVLDGLGHQAPPGLRETALSCSAHDLSFPSAESKTSKPSLWGEHLWSWDFVLRSP